MGLAVAASLGVLGGGCGRIVNRMVPAHDGPLTFDIPAEAARDVPAARLLARAAFGPTAALLAAIERDGAPAWLGEQLAAPADDSGESTGLQLRVRTMDVSYLSACDLRDEDDGAVLRQLQQGALLRAVYGRYPLRERMVDFWTNHFNIYGRKGYGASYKSVDDVQVIRRHALGTFPELLRASAHSPAMLSYLDNQINQRGVANENYARELMELHTLGVHGGYTQKDVQEVARCLTGWTVEDRFLHRKGTFRYDGSRHDDGPKVVLGHQIPAGGGETDGDTVLNILSVHPSTAHFIASKLVRYFYGRGGDEDVQTERIAAIYRSTGGSISAMVDGLLLGDGPHGIQPALLAAPPILKRPYDFVVSALRGLGAETDGGQGVQEHLAQMGQPLFQWPMPDGYPDKTGSWTGSLLARWNFAFALAFGSVKGTTIALNAENHTTTLDAMLDALLPGAAEATSASLRTALHTQVADPASLAALVLASPAFQWR